MKKVAVFSTTTMVALLLLQVTAESGVVFEHAGANNPTTEGFSAAGTLVGQQDAGPPESWKILTGTCSGGDNNWGEYSYSVPTSVYASSTGWTLTTCYKLEIGSAQYKSDILMWDGITDFGLHMIDGSYPGENEGDPSPYPAGLYYMGNGDVAVKVGTVDPTDDFHYYQMILNPNGAGTADDEMSIYVDGVCEATLLRSDFTARTSTGFYWGQATAGESISYCTLMRLETGQNVFTPPTIYPGDADKDGDVDTDDAATLAENWLVDSGANWYMGDFNGDGKVDDVDATILATNWSGSSNSAVPEPACFIVLIGFMASLLLRRKV